MDKNKIKSIVFPLTLGLILVGAVLHSFAPSVAPYVLLAGVAGYAAMTFTTPYPGKSIRGKRLFNMQIIAVLLMIAATYLMFVHMNIWVLPMLVSAILILYSALVLPKVLEKEKEEEKK